MEGKSPKKLRTNWVLLSLLYAKKKSANIKEMNKREVHSFIFKRMI